MYLANIAARHSYTVHTQFINLSRGQETNCQLIDHNNKQIHLYETNKKMQNNRIQSEAQDRMKKVRINRKGVKASNVFHNQQSQN